MKKIIKIWIKLTSFSFMTSIANRFSLILFLIGKILRFSSFLIFLLIILARTKTLAGYNSNQAVFFLLTYNLIDTMGQMLFREVYRFRQMVISGNFDLVLVKPINPLIKVLFGGADVIDFILIFPLAIAIIILGGKIGTTSIFSVINFLTLCFNALLIATSFHIFVLALGVLTTEVDNTIMLYRDISRMGIIPIDLYKEPLRSILTFIIPIGIMVTFPAKALMGLLSLKSVIISFIIGFIFIFFSLKFWKFSLTKYSSASS